MMNAWGNARDQIALVAMKAMLMLIPGVAGRTPVNVIASDAYKMADAMLRRRDIPAQEGSDG